jgi:succinate dehydrogenase / fumarate reductase flavoprotein subunit
VFGRRAGEAAAGLSRSRDFSLRSRAIIAGANDELDALIHKGDEFARPLQRALRNAMWQYCGVVRNEDGLRQALAEIAGIEQRLPDIDVRPTSEGYGDLAHALDLRASLAAASATVRGALERRETRGAHVRSDFPELDPDLRVNIQISLDDGAMTVTPAPVPDVPSELRRYVEQTEGLELKGRLLE